MLSKSKYLYGIQCPKLLWAYVNDSSNIPKPSIETQYVFDQGHKVGELATKLFPDGIYLDTDNFSDNIRQTKEYLKKHKPLFEAGIYTDGLYSRVDILKPVGRSKWDIIEVKSSTSVKDVNIHDVSLDVNTAIPCGLIINELVSNSLKHAFKDREEGTVEVALNKESDGTYLLSVSDDGVGLPEGLDLKNTDSLGMQLVMTLIQQLDGSFQVEGYNGTKFHIRFGELEYKERD